MATNINEYLQEVLDTHRMSHIQILLNKYTVKRDEVKEYLEEYYGSKMYSPINSGSYAKSTHINTKFDLDIVAPFKRDSFSTIEDMFEDVYKLLCEKFNDVAEVRKQKVSIGVIFPEDEDGDSIDIDVVPGRELNKGSYSGSKDLNIYFNDNLWGFSKGTHTKTNIQAQINHISGKSSQREIIRLFKIWKSQNRLDYKSFLFELITIKAFNKSEISGSLWDRLKGVIEYIKENITKEDFTLKDPGNSNNNVLDTLSSNDRANLSSKMANIIDNVEYNSDNIKTYFRVNKNFAQEESSESKYGFKDSSLDTPIIPKTPQRFG